jgi:hypothetical protein
MTPNQTTDEIVERLKLLFPEPWFCNWRVGYGYEGDGNRVIDARVDVLGMEVGTPVLLVATRPYNCVDGLLAAVESLPLPEPAAATSRTRTVTVESLSKLLVRLKGLARSPTPAAPQGQEKHVETDEEYVTRMGGYCRHGNLFYECRCSED